MPKSSPSSIVQDSSYYTRLGKETELRSLGEKAVQILAWLGPVKRPAEQGDRRAQCVRRMKPASTKTAYRRTAVPTRSWLLKVGVPRTTLVLGKPLGRDALPVSAAVLNRVLAVPAAGPSNRG
jgi:hypothetical protein